MAMIRPFLGAAWAVHANRINRPELRSNYNRWSRGFCIQSVPADIFAMKTVISYISGSNLRIGIITRPANSRFC